MKSPPMASFFSLPSKAKSPPPLEKEFSISSMPSIDPSVSTFAKARRRRERGREEGEERWVEEGRWRI